MGDFLIHDIGIGSRAAQVTEKFFWYKKTVMNLAIASDRIRRQIRLWASWLWRQGRYCDGCGQRIDEGEVWTAEHGQEWCQSCKPLH